VIYGGYRVHQSFEAGYRFSDVKGNESMFNNLINLHDGPRIFEQTLFMQSENHQGVLFDDLSLNSVGWGGDPNNYLRMRVHKNEWYDFRASFRRDQDYFDYNLLANPLNPATSVPNVPVAMSPHGFATRRRMSDFDLSLLPQSRFSFRLGFSHNNMSGPSFTSLHEGTDALLAQPWSTTQNAYRLGVDFQLMPRTVVSYDQFFNYYKGDTSAQLNGATYTLTGGANVDLGLPFNTVSGQPCATPLLGDGTVNPTCNGYFSYSRLDARRNSFPTEQLSLRSNYFRQVDVSGSFSYTSGNLKMPNYAELYNGLTSRTRMRNSLSDGTAVVKRDTSAADAGVVVHLTERARLVDTFRFYSFRLPSDWNYTIGAFFGATLLSTPNVFAPATCPPPYTAATCPQHNASSGADLTVGLRQDFLKQDLKSNTVELQYDFTRKIVARLGYRYQRRTIVNSLNDVQDQTFYPSLATRGACATGTVDANGVCTVTVTAIGSGATEIQAHSLLAGASVRPSTSLRLSFDAEKFYADHAFTRISPRKESRYRVVGSYAPRPWAVIGAAVNTLTNSNGDAQINARGHSYNYGFNASLNPRARLGLDLAYDYSDYLQNALICFNDTPPAGVVLPVVTNAGDCSANDAANPLLTDSYYQNNTHFGMFALMVKPLPRLTTRAGYSVTSVDGKTPQFNALQPLGSLAYNYYQPIASLDLDLVHNLTWHAGWNYSQYGEKDFVGPTTPRYFHANDMTLSLKYAF
jgi:opacity protein-like surface antigen